MTSIRKAKKLGIYKVPKYTKERSELIKETRKITSQVNKRLKALNTEGYKGTWASKKLINRLKGDKLNAYKKGRVVVPKTATRTDLVAIQKKSRQFLASATSTRSGIEKVKKQTIESLRATFSTDKKLEDVEVETAYEMLSNKDFEYFNNEDRVGASTLWALIEDAIEYNQSEETFLNNLLNIYESSADKDARVRAKRLYDKYVL